MNKYPIYIVSKGRAQTSKTDKALDALGVAYYIIIEEQEFEEYSQYKDVNKLLILPQKYKDEYETFDELGFTKSIGPGAARNFAWEHSIENGFKWHWVMDDNIYQFHRFWKRAVLLKTPKFFTAVESFVNRFNNVAISGLNYSKFLIYTSEIKPIFLNTRIYSCLLIRNDIPFRWRGRYNEDTDICLRALKAGWGTIQINTFACDKATTKRFRGGNSKEFYDEDGTFNKSQMLVDMHPDVATLSTKFHRTHHHVNYKPFYTNDLGLKEEFKRIPKGSNEFGMKLVDKNGNDLQI